MQHPLRCRAHFTPIAALLLVALAVAGCAEQNNQTPAPVPAPAGASALVIDGPWARPTAPVATVGAAYLTITNHGVNADRLLSASSPVAARIELHGTSIEAGVARMRPIANLEVGSHQTAAMDPGGMHLMLLDLTTPLVAGHRFPLTLTFETAGAITVEVVVQDGSKRADAGG